VANFGHSCYIPESSTILYLLYIVGARPRNGVSDIFDQHSGASLRRRDRGHAVTFFVCSRTSNGVADFEGFSMDLPLQQPCRVSDDTERLQLFGTQGTARSGPRPGAFG